MQNEDIFTKAAALSGEERTTFLHDEGGEDLVSEYAAWELDPTNKIMTRIKDFHAKYPAIDLNDTQQNKVFNEIMNAWTKLPTDGDGDDEIFKALTADSSEAFRTHVRDALTRGRNPLTKKPDRHPSEPPSLDSLKDASADDILHALVHAKTAGLKSYSEEEVKTAAGERLTPEIEKLGEQIAYQTVSVTTGNDRHGFQAICDEAGSLYAVEMRGKGDDKKEVRTLIADHFIIVGRARDLEGEKWTYIFKFRTADGVWKEMLVPCADVSPNDQKWMAPLRDSGAVILDSAKLAKLVIATESRKIISLATRPGWQNKEHAVFVLPNGDVIGGIGETVSRFKKRSGYGRKGTKEGADALLAKCVGNSRLILTVCTHLAAPLLKFMGVDPGMVHLFGASGSGKTTCQRVGLSTEASGDEKQAWRTTDNGLEGRAADTDDGTLVFEDTKQTDGATLQKSIMMIGNGAGKQRSTREGEARDTKKFTVMVSSSGEASVRDQMVADKRVAYDAGIASRCTDVPADAGCGRGAFENIHGAESSAAFAKQLEIDARTDYGHHLPLLIEAVVKDPEGVKAEILTTKNAVYAKIGLSGDENVTRPAERFALMAAVGECAAKRKIVPWPEGEATRGILKIVEAWKANRKGDTEVIGKTEVIEAYSAWRDMLASNSERFQWIPGRGKSSPEKDSPPFHTVQRDRLGFREQMDGETVCYYLTGSELRKIVGSERFAEFIKALKEDKMPGLALKREKDGKRPPRDQCTTPSAASGPLGKRCYGIIVAGEGDDGVAFAETSLMSGEASGAALH